MYGSGLESTMYKVMWDGPLTGVNRSQAYLFIIGNLFQRIVKPSIISVEYLV